MIEIGITEFWGIVISSVIIGIMLMAIMFTVVVINDYWRRLK